MPHIRRPRVLRCFYCNKSQGWRYESGITSFECPSCEATNYLDEAGDITDPPLQATLAPSSAHFARPSRVSSASLEPRDSIFCKTCVKNQHLFTSSLAQYLPEDPNDPEYAALERNYYSFRAGLEKRYPQICAACEPKVAARLRQARYTAKTDYLRRMMEQSRANRHARKGLTSLDVLHRSGKALWWAGVVAQLLWHMSMLDRLAVPLLDMLSRPQWFIRSIRLASTAVRLLPPAHDILNFGLVASLMALWWNPRFPQVFRGFSKPVLGLGSWYGLQAGGLVARFVFPRLDDMESSQADEAMAHLSVHFVASMVFIYLLLASRSVVKLDATPLFATSESPSSLSRPDKSPAPIRSHSRAVPEAKRELEAKSLSSILDDILTTSPPRPSSPLSPSPLRRTNFNSSPIGSSRPHMDSSPLQSGSPVSRHSNFSHTTPVQQSSFKNHTPKRLQAISQDDDAMDWSPTQPQIPVPSAFQPPSTFQSGASSLNPFSSSVQLPHDNSLGFSRYKGSQTPTQRYVSQRAAAMTASSALNSASSPLTSRGYSRNAFGAPVTPRSKNPFALAASRPESPPSHNGHDDPFTNGLSPPKEKSTPPVTFADARFFAPTPKNDPRTDLAVYLNRSFSLGPDDESTAADSASVRATSPAGSISSIFSSPQIIAQRAAQHNIASTNPPPNPFALQLLHSPLALPALLVLQVGGLWAVSLAVDDDLGLLCREAALCLAGAMAVFPVWTCITSLFAPTPVSSRLDAGPDDSGSGNASGSSSSVAGFAFAKTLAEAVVSVAELAGVAYYSTAVWLRDDSVAVEEGGSIVVAAVLIHHALGAIGLGTGRERERSAKYRDTSRGSSVMRLDTSEY
ncbi:Integral inner nuclear membrane protein ima1 [Ceratocystis fimbriata CBS 114723]|uniref:Integral inner nuclear membrane protein ima1 n=1 Tax=Ceratocystis fimbriata CBS 114723 TaxID=1035309 RepID=A0A2C5X6B0_9PEZI|nr:Integral inner nuclear membrane protein ima1 [Ceratocystis fimbriata CBS 114723]